MPKRTEYFLPGSEKQGLLTTGCFSQIHNYMDNDTFLAESVENVCIYVFVYTPPWEAEPNPQYYCYSLKRKTQNTTKKTPHNQKSTNRIAYPPNHPIRGDYPMLTIWLLQQSKRWRMEYISHCLWEIDLKSVYLILKGWGKGRKRDVCEVFHVGNCQLTVWDGWIVRIHSSEDSRPLDRLTDTLNHRKLTYQYLTSF